MEYSASKFISNLEAFFCAGRKKELRFKLKCKAGNPVFKYLF